MQPDRRTLSNCVYICCSLECGTVKEQKEHTHELKLINGFFWQGCHGTSSWVCANETPFQSLLDPTSNERMMSGIQNNACRRCPLARKNLFWALVAWHHMNVQHQECAFQQDNKTQLYSKVSWCQARTLHIPPILKPNSSWEGDCLKLQKNLPATLSHALIIPTAKGSPRLDLILLAATHNWQNQSQHEN